MASRGRRVLSWGRLESGGVRLIGVNRANERGLLEMSSMSGELTARWAMRRTECCWTRSSRVWLRGLWVIRCQRAKSGFSMPPIRMVLRVEM